MQWAKHHKPTFLTFFAYNSLRMYVSPVDVLKISADALMALDKKGLIRLEKQLKAQMLTSGRGTYNPQQFDALLDQLGDDDKKRSIFFIEKHPALKQFITDGTDVGPKTFSIDQNLLEQTPHLSEFLAPYFEVFFMAMVKRNLKSGRYDTIVEALKTNELFTAGLRTTYSQFVTQQLDVVTERIRVTQSGQLIKNFPYLHYSSFIHMLNTVSEGYIKKSMIAYVNALNDYYNAKKKSHELERLELIFYNFIHIKVNDPDLKNQLVRLAMTIGNSSNTGHGQKKGSSYGVSSVITIVLIFFAIIRFGVRMTKNNSSDYTPSFQIENQSYALENALKTMGRKHMHNLFSDIVFYAETPLDSSYKRQVLIHNSNPYGNLAKAFIYQKNAKPVYNIAFSNQRNKEPIIVLVHTETEGILKSMAIGSKRQANIQVRRGERLSFYVGSHWVKKDSVDNNGHHRARVFFKELNEQQLGIFKVSYGITSAGKKAGIKVYGDRLVFNDLETKTWQKQANENTYSDEAQEMDEEVVMETVVMSTSPETPTTTKKEDTKLWYKSKRKFMKNLEGYFDTTDSLVSFDFDPYSGQNPYPNAFLKISDTRIKGTTVPIENYSRQEDMVFFGRNLPAKRDRATFIAVNSVATASLMRGDTLSFYMGTNMRTINPQNGRNDLNPSIPQVFFEKSTEEAKALFKRRFVIRAIGEDPKILVTGKDAGFKDLKVKRL